MSHADDINNLRERLRAAVEAGIAGNDFILAKAMLEEIVTQAERFRAECIRQSESLMNQAKAAQHQAEAYSAIGAIVNRVFNGFIGSEERRLAEEKARQEELKQQEEPAEPAPPEQRKRRKRADQTPGE